MGNIVQVQQKIQIKFHGNSCPDITRETKDVKNTRGPT